MSAIAYLQGSFRATAAATIRLTRTDTAQTVDWTVAEGDTWNSGDELVADWTATIQADPNFGSAFSVDLQRDTANHYCVAYYTGAAAGSVAWSHSGDGSDLRDWLVGSGAGATTAVTSGQPINADMPASFVAPYGLTRCERSSTSRQRGQFVALSGAQYSQHHTSPDDLASVTLDVELRFGRATSAAAGRIGVYRWRSFVDALFDTAGGGEPFSMFAADETQATPDQWVLRFSGSALRTMMARHDQAERDRIWSVGFTAEADDLPW